MTSMTGKISFFLYLGIFFMVLVLIDQTRILLFEISPITILSLDSDIWIGAIFTFTASLLAFIIGGVLGYGLGILVGASVLDLKTNRGIRVLGMYANSIYDGFYIIPLVLTVSFWYAIAFLWHLKYGMPSFFIGLILVSIAGLSLGGYNVYHSVFHAVFHAKQENICLTESLFLKRTLFGLEKIFGENFIQCLKITKLLVDCQIHSFAESLERAFHLSIVAIIILESVTLSFYELVLPQSGAYKPWLGGLGRLILSAQQNNQFEIIAGVIWLVLLFDLLVLYSIKTLIKSNWTVFYRR